MILFYVFCFFLWAFFILPTFKFTNFYFLSLLNFFFSVSNSLHTCSSLCFFDFFFYLSFPNNKSLLAFNLVSKRFIESDSSLHFRKSKAKKIGEKIFEVFIFEWMHHGNKEERKRVEYLFSDDQLSSAEKICFNLYY